MTKQTIISAAAVFLLTACEPDEPYWSDVCVKSHTKMIMRPTVIGKSVISMMQPMTICDKRQTQCIIPNKYAGEPQCKPIEQEKIKP